MLMARFLAPDRYGLNHDYTEKSSLYGNGRSCLGAYRKLQPVAVESLQSSWNVYVCVCLFTEG